MSSHSQILLVSHDQMLLQSRRLILGAYFEVEAAGRVQEARSILSRYTFDLIVFCDTLSDAECQQVAELVRDQKPLPILLSLLGPGTRNQERNVGRKLNIARGPLQLLKQCAEMLGHDLHGKRAFSN